MQITSDGGIGSLALGLTSLSCFTLAGIGWWQKFVKYSLFDWLALAGGLLAILLWWLTANPLLAVILISLADAVGYLPTFRKGYRFPYTEPITTYALDVLKYILALVALHALTLNTGLYISVIIILDSLFVVMLLLRRRQMENKKESDDTGSFTPDAG